MQYRKHKNEQISTLGIGCYSLSGVYGEKNINQFKKMLHHAYEQGVNFFDTAEAYGNAEKILGEAVKPFRDQIKIATKVGIKNDSKANLSAEYIQQACEHSLRQLNTDRIDLYQVHFDDPETPIEETLNTLETLKNAGKICHYGIGHISKERAQLYMKNGQPFSMMMELSAVADESRKTYLPLCKQYDVGAIAFSVTGRGILTGKITKNTQFNNQDIRKIDPLFQRERFLSALRVAKKLSHIGKQHGRTPVQVAIAWVLAQPQVLCALCGPSNITHLEENLSAVDWNFPEEEQVNFDHWLVEEKNTLIHAQLCTVEDILQNPLHPDSNQAFTDLLYAVETAINADWVKENTILPVFLELFGLRENADQSVNHKLKPIQKKLAELIIPGMRTHEGQLSPGI